MVSAKQKATIRRRLRDKVRFGHIKKPKGCFICNLTNKVLEAHHISYEKDEMYIWVCKDCHSLIHKGFKYNAEGIKIQGKKSIKTRHKISKSLKGNQNRKKIRS